MPRVVELPELLVAVPRDAVVPVAVVVQPDAPEAARRSASLSTRGAPRRAPGAVPARPRETSASSRGSSTMRSYIQRLPCFHSTRASSTSSSVSAPRSQLARDVDPAVVVEVDALEGRPRVDLGLAPPSRVPWRSIPARVANICSLRNPGRRVRRQAAPAATSAARSSQPLREALVVQPGAEHRRRRRHRHAPRTRHDSEVRARDEQRRSRARRACSRACVRCASAPVERRRS